MFSTQSIPIPPHFPPRSAPSSSTSSQSHPSTGRAHGEALERRLRRAGDLRALRREARFRAPWGRSGARTGRGRSRTVAQAPGEPALCAAALPRLAGRAPRAASEVSERSVGGIGRSEHGERAGARRAAGDAEPGLDATADGGHQRLLRGGHKRRDGRVRV